MKCRVYRSKHKPLAEVLGLPSLIINHSLLNVLTSLPPCTLARTSSGPDRNTFKHQSANICSSVNCPRYLWLGVGDRGWQRPPGFHRHRNTHTRTQTGSHLRPAGQPLQTVQTTAPLPADKCPCIQNSHSRTNYIKHDSPTQILRLWSPEQQNQFVNSLLTLTTSPYVNSNTSPPATF